MGERKVLNKYIPPNFDPQLVPRSKKPKDDLIPVRMMLPFSIQCATCSSFLYRGRKFNSKKEPVKGINGKYLGIQRFRFYIKCSECSRPITFLTDPKNADYEMESGGTRNYEVWHDERETNQRFEEEAEEEEKMDGMKALENRVLESQREMAEMDALEEIRAMNARHVGLMKGKVGAALGFEALGGGKGEEEEELELNENGLTREEEDLVKSIKFGAPLPLAGEAADSSDSVVIRRLDEEDEILAEKARQKEAEALLLQSSKSDNKRGVESDANESREKRKMNVPVFKVKRKKQKEGNGSAKASNPSITSSASTSSEKQNDELETTKVTTTVTSKSTETPRPAQNSKTEDNDSSSDGGGGGGLGGLLGNYGSDDSD